MITCTPAGPEIDFAGRYPQDFLLSTRRDQLPAWHLVGGLDVLEPGELTGAEPQDGYPVLLADWIRRDGLKCLKVKLRGNDAAWDYQRLVRAGQIGLEGGVEPWPPISTAPCRTRRTSTRCSTACGTSSRGSTE